MIAVALMNRGRATTIKEHRFQKTRECEYVCTTWFERDRANVRLETPAGREVFDLWDNDVYQAIEDGLLSTPRVPRPTDLDWQPHAVAYAVSSGLLQVASRGTE